MRKRRLRERGETTLRSRRCFKGHCKGENLPKGQGVPNHAIQRRRVVLLKKKARLEKGTVRPTTWGHPLTKDFEKKLPRYHLDVHIEGGHAWGGGGMAS